MSHILSAAQWLCVGCELGYMFGNDWRRSGYRLVAEYTLLAAFWFTFYRSRTEEQLGREALWTAVLVACVAIIKIQILQWQREDAAAGPEP